MTCLLSLPHDLLFAVASLSNNSVALRSTNRKLRECVHSFFFVQSEGRVVQRPVRGWKITTGSTFFTEQHVTVHAKSYEHDADEVFQVDFFFEVDTTGRLCLSSAYVALDNCRVVYFDKYQCHCSTCVLAGTMDVGSFLSDNLYRSKDAVILALRRALCETAKELTDSSRACIPRSLGLSN